MQNNYEANISFVVQAGLPLIKEKPGYF